MVSLQSWLGGAEKNCVSMKICVCLGLKTGLFEVYLGWCCRLAVIKRVYLWDWVGLGGE